MKLLWFEVTEPALFKSKKEPIGGWQDSLERIVRTIPNIELAIAFISSQNETKVIDGVTYIPIHNSWSFVEKKFKRHWDIYVKKTLPDAIKIVQQYRPDLIQIFGTEWPFGQIAARTNVPIVIHLMGAIVSYHNAEYPPNYSYFSLLLHNWYKPDALFHIWQDHQNCKNWKQWEIRTWNLVENYMGRTHWDESLSRIMHKGRNYFHVDEALRLEFLSGCHQWKITKGEKLKLISTGCSSFWKGPDMMLKVAAILTDLNVNFEWIVVGRMDTIIRQSIEHQENKEFENCHIHILGYKKAEELVNLLCNSSMYIHTSYAENSPNSICEAQCLGVPIVSTNVGGISSLIRQDVDGILIPSNDPIQMADAILELFKDKERMVRYSTNSRAIALKRHNDENIKNQLLNCYKTILSPRGNFG